METPKVTEVTPVRKAVAYDHALAWVVNNFDDFAEVTAVETVMSNLPQHPIPETDAHPNPGEAPHAPA